MTINLAASLYLISGVLFILALRGLSSPETSRQGNLFGILGMALAIIVTFLSVDILFNSFIFILCTLLAGGFVGAIVAYRISMTAMPQLVSFYNGMGGICAALISLIELPHHIADPSFDGNMNNGFMLAVLLGLIIILRIGPDLPLLSFHEAVYLLLVLFQSSVHEPSPTVLGKN